jgi:hypothetical protein
LESEGGGEVVDMDQDDEDILQDNVVMDGKAETGGDIASGSRSSESEDEEEDEMMDERPEDPIVAVRNLFEREEGLARDGMGQNEEVSLPVIKPVLDNRYYAVRGLRKKSGHGKDWDESGVGAEMERASFLTPEDDRILFNSNHFSLEKKKNISRSFDLEGICVTCPSGPHSALAGKEGKPVVFCLADQHFSPAAPADDGRECMRILRVEDASLRELTSEFLDWVEGRELIVGSVILLGSVFQLSVDGTAQYVEDWHHCQRRLKEAVEGIMVLPLIPVPLEGVKDKETVRSLLEFFLWFEDLPDAEARLMENTRDEYKKTFLGRIGAGPGWCNDRQSIRLPLSLTGGGKPPRPTGCWERDQRQSVPSMGIWRESGYPKWLRISTHASTWGWPRI